MLQLCRCYVKTQYICVNSFFATLNLVSSLICYSCLTDMWDLDPPSNEIMSKKIEIGKNIRDLSNKLTCIILCTQSESFEICIWVSQLIEIEDEMVSLNFEYCINLNACLMMVSVHLTTCTSMHLRNIHLFIATGLHIFLYLIYLYSTMNMFFTDSRRMLIPFKK